MPWKAVRSASPAVVSWPRYRCGAGAAAAPAESGIPPPAPAKENPRPLNRRMTKKISNPMISTVSNPPNTWPRPPMPPPRLLNSIEPRKPPASPLMNGWRWKKLPPIAPAPAPAPASGLVADGVWVMLRESGAAPLLSKVRVPRLPMLEPPPLEELPARASARLGASASVRQKNSGSRMRHCTMCPSRGCAADRLNMIISVRAAKKALVLKYRASARRQKTNRFGGRACRRISRRCGHERLLDRWLRGSQINYRIRATVAGCRSGPGSGSRSPPRRRMMSRVALFNSPLLLGFEHFERALDRVNKISGDGYPPYNVEQLGDNELRITLAVAGFTMADLTITVEDNQLVIRGKQADDAQRVYLHRGIAAR